MQCPVCGTRPTQIGLLCEDCRDELAIPTGMAPEQVMSSTAKPLAAVLIDTWGRTHRLGSKTLVGRHLDGSGISILDSGVSRHHAHIAWDASHGQWVLRDLGSANGTSHNEQLITDAVTLSKGDRIAFAHIGFYFVDKARDLPSLPLDPTAGDTIRPSDRLPAPDLPERPLAAAVAPLGVGSEDDFKEPESTDVGLPVLEIVLSEPTGGGGGLVDIQGKQVQLTTTQFEFVRLLVDRMAAEAHQPVIVRGFVRTTELIADLSWDTREPGDNHVKQLVRRVRRAMIKAGMSDLVESRHRFGYRLRAIPKPAA